MPTLAQYTTSTQRLLHDATFQFWSQAELTDYINAARKKTVGDTGCYRQLQTIYLSNPIETYQFGTLTGFTVLSGGSGYVTPPGVILTGGGGTGAAGTAIINNGAVTGINMTLPGSGYTSAPAVSFSSGAATASASILNPLTIDVLNITVLWGSQRTPCYYRVWSDFNAYVRPYLNNLGTPSVFSMYGQNTAYIGRIPDQPYISEWDTVITPPDLVQLTDNDVLIWPWYDPVPYYAAALAKEKEQSFQEATNFENKYKMKCLAALTSTFTRRLPDPYA